MAGERADRDTRASILEVAETQFGTKGYSGTHLQSIAEEVGVQKTALYYYFESKQALYAAVLERMLESFDAVMGGKSRGAPSRESLESALDDLNQVLAGNPNFSQIIVRIFVDRITVDDSLIRPTMIRIMTPILQFYSKGVELGVFRKLSSRQVLMTVIGAAVFYYASDGSSSEIVEVDDIFEPSAVEWRRGEFNRFIMGALLVEGDDSSD